MGQRALERLIRLLLEHAQSDVDIQTSGPRSWTQFSVALQCLADLGARGGEETRNALVRVGSLDISWHVLEGWLAQGPGDEWISHQARYSERIAEQAAPIGLQKPAEKFSGTSMIQVSRDGEASNQAEGETVVDGAAQTLSSSEVGSSTMPSEEEIAIIIHQLDTDEGHLEVAFDEVLQYLEESKNDPTTKRPWWGPSTTVQQERRSEASAAASGKLDFTDGDVLSVLQLLAYLSKHSHLRQAMYSAPSHSSTPQDAAEGPTVLKQGNLLTLVEHFAFKPSSTSPAPPTHHTHLLPEIKYWAETIMRNTCRSDEEKRGIRRCAHPLCGRWEAFPKEFPKCRRCRTAKYCGAACQAEAWRVGHRYWCREKGAGTSTAGTKPLFEYKGMSRSPSNPVMEASTTVRIDGEVVEKARL